MSDDPIAAYAHRPRPYSQGIEFRLMPEHLTIGQGLKSGDLHYGDIAMIKVMFKPRNSSGQGYATTIYRRGGRTTVISNLSWKNLLEVETQDASYRRFIEALVRQTAARNPAVILKAGMPRWLHLLTGVAGAATVAGASTVVVHALWTRNWPMALFAALMAMYFGWWSFRYVSLNTPRAFGPDAIPEDVLPKAVGSRQ